MGERFYIYNLSFVGVGRWGSTPMLLESPIVTEKDIDKAKEAAKMRPTAIVVSVSYLGYMTEKEFNAKD